MTNPTDPMARAIHAFHFQKSTKKISILSEQFDEDQVDPAYFFRTFGQMPTLEQQALIRCRGRVLDVGAGAGCHALYLQEKKLDLVALEKAPDCCKVMADRGVRQIVCADFFDYEGQQFDTILVLMNGTGIAGTLNGLDRLFLKMKELLRSGGQVLIDSSDLIYLYLNEDGSADMDLNADHYYGEIVYQTVYEKEKSAPFPWLYVDSDTLAEKAREHDFVVKEIIQGDHYDYLACLTR